MIEYSASGKTAMIAHRYPPNIAKLIDHRQQMPLDAGIADPGVVEVLDDALIERLFGKEILKERTSARLCIAGLWLLYDHLEECHRIAQSIETQDGSYWHAIMHRREGDFSNSKYWYRRVGMHEIFPQLLERTRSLARKQMKIDCFSGNGGWDPYAFVDACEDAVNGDAGWREVCIEIQQVEWELLFDWCYRKAIDA